MKCHVLPGSGLTIILDMLNFISLFPSDFTQPNLPALMFHESSPALCFFTFGTY